MRRVLFSNTNWSSPYVLSAFVSLREKGLEFEVRDVALHAAEHHSPEYAKQTLTSRVPVLLEDDFALSESSAISEYLEEAYPAPHYARLLPSELRARARARQVMAWLRSDLAPLREERSAQCVFFPLSELAPFPPLSAAGVAAARKLIAVAEQLVPQAAGPMFGDWCLADTDLAMMLQRLIKTDSPVPERIRRYAEAEWLRPSVRSFCAHERPAFRPVIPQF